MPQIPAQISIEVAPQLENLVLERGRPLVITDADEVLLYFARHFEAFLSRRGYGIHFQSYALLGNVFDRETGESIAQAQIFQLVDSFFAEEATCQTPVEGAAEALAMLATKAQIVVLTNVPKAQHELRIEMLKTLGMDYPVIANTGLKGPVVDYLSRTAAAPAIFIDDIDRHHTSVATHAPATYRLHFVADPRLAAIAPPAEHCHYRCDEWPSTAAHLAAHLTAELARRTG